MGGWRTWLELKKVVAWTRNLVLRKPLVWTAVFGSLFLFARSLGTLKEWQSTGRHNGSGAARDNPLSVSGHEGVTLTGGVGAVCPQPHAAANRENVERWHAADAAPEHRAFAEWVAHYDAAAPIQRTALLEQGVNLAEARRKVLASRLDTAPASLFVLAAPVGLAERLPAPVARLLERRVSAAGTLNADWICGHWDGQGCETCDTGTLRHAVTVGEITYDAVPLGAPTSWWAQRLDINGVLVPGGETGGAPRLALSPWPARIVSPDEPAEDVPVTIERAGRRATYPTLKAAQDAESGLPPAGWDALAYGGPDLPEAMADSVMPTGGGPSGNADPAMSKGLNRRCLLIRHTFPGRPGFISDANILAGYEGFREIQARTSYGQNTYAPASSSLTATNTWLLPPLAMPGTWSDYADNKRDIIRESYDLIQPLLQAAGQDFDDFSHFILAFDNPNLVTGNASGYATYGPWYPSYPGFPAHAKLGRAAVWAKEDGYWNRFILTHECGHNLRQVHAHKWETSDRSVIGPGSHSEYNDPYDYMAGANGGRGYNAAARLWLGYLPAADAPLLTETGTTNVTLYALDENPASPQVRALRVKHAIDTTQSYWVEHRRGVAGATPSDEDMHSVFIRRGGSNGQEAWWMEWRGPRLGANHLYAGHTFADRAADLFITPVEQVGTTNVPAISIVVTRGPVSDNHPPSFSLAASNTNVARNASITLTAAGATDPDGDALAYGWDFGDGKLSWNNSAVQTKSYGSVGDYVVQSRVSDMRGGETRKSVVIRVGSPTTRRLSGRVFVPEGPAAGIRVAAGGKYALTDSDGGFTLVGLTNATYTVTAHDPVADAYDFDDLSVTLAGADVSDVAFFGEKEGSAQAGLTGQYYTGTAFNTLTLTRRDAAVDFDWGEGTPGWPVPADGFSARWTGRLLATRSGAHAFRLLADSGARLYLDGALVIDQWASTAEAEHVGWAVLQAGRYHEIKVEMQHPDGLARVRLSWLPPGEDSVAAIPNTALWTGLNGVVAEYYSGTGLAPSQFKRSRIETARIDYTFNSVGPSVPGISRTSFSARWTARLKAPASGTFTFHTDAGDGVRLWIGGTQVINDWATHDVTQRVGTATLTSGQLYDLRLEYYQTGGTGAVKLSWIPPGGAKAVIPITALTPADRTDHLCAAFWDNPALDGEPRLSRWDDDIDFSWTGAPETGLPADGWSARWTGRIKSGPAGLYALQTLNDDGVRVWIDDAPVIDAWQSGSATRDGSVTLASNTWYNLKVDYFDSTGSGLLRLRWKPAGASSYVIVPSANLALWGGNSAPFVYPPPDQYVASGQTLAVAAAGADAERAALSWTLGAGAPLGAAIDPDSGLFTWTPSATQTGVCAVTVIASDDATPPLSGSARFDVHVGAGLVWTGAAPRVSLPWSAAANWKDGLTPGPQLGNTVAFFPGVTLPAASVTSRVDSAAGQALNSLTLAGTGPASGSATLNLVGDALRFGRFGSATPLVSLAATNGNGLSYTVATLLSADAPLAFDGNGTATFQFSGALACPGGIVKRGNSTLILAGTNTLAYAEVQAGTLQVGRGTAAGDLGAGPVTNNALLRLHRGDNSTFANVLSGSGELRLGLASGGVVGAVTTLTGDNTFSGDIRIESGALRIPRPEVLGTTSKQVLFGNGTAGKSRVIFAPEGGGMTIPASVTWKASNPDATYPGLFNESGDTRLEGALTLTSGGGGTRVVVQAGHLTLAGPVAPDTSNRSLLLDGPGDGTVSGPIRDQNAANTLAVEQYGSGTWTLTGSNTYTRGTTVSAGTLRVNGSLASLVSVSSGATLSGTGTLAAVTLSGLTNAPAWLAPGAGGIGMLRATGAVSFAAGSAYRWEISDWNGAPGLGYDQVSAGTLAVSATPTNPFTVIVSPLSLTNFTTASRAFPILTVDSTLGTLDAQCVRVDASAFPVGEGSWLAQTSDNLLELVYLAAVPEPPFKWTGATNSDWSVGGNWTGGSVPGTTDMPIFAAAAAVDRNPTLSAPVTVPGLLFNNDAASGITLQVTKENRLTLAAGGSVAVTAGVHTIGGPYVGTGSGTTEMSLAGNSTWHVEAGGVLTNAARLGGPSGKTVTKSGAGLLVLDNNNGGSGGYQTSWSVVAGSLRFSQPGAAGNSANAVTVSTGASVELANGAGLGASGGATLSGLGAVGAGALRVVSGSTVLSGSGKLVLAADATFGVDAGASLEVGKIVSESGGTRQLTKVGAGTLRLAMTNLYSGVTVVSAGTLSVACNNALRPGNALLLAGGTFDAGVFTNALSTLTLADGTVNTIAVNGGACALSFTGLSGTGALTVTGRLGLTALRFGMDGLALTPSQLARIGNDGHEVCLTPLGYLVRKQRGVLLQIR